MGEKSVQKREYIIEKARKVFSEKGYRSVTMKDIVEECGISRGGLYLYFDSTKEVFEAVLQSEATKAEDNFASEIKDADTATDILTIFLREQKKEILRKKNSLTAAIYEYYFDSTVSKKSNGYKSNFEGNVKILGTLIEGGVKSGEFVCEDPKGMAKHIMLVIEGLKASSCTMGITEDAVNKEILIIMSSLVEEE